METPLDLGLQEYSIAYMDLKVNIKFAFWGDGGDFVLAYSGGGDFFDFLRIGMFDLLTAVVVC